MFLIYIIIYDYNIYNTYIIYNCLYNGFFDFIANKNVADKILICHLDINKAFENSISRDVILKNSHGNMIYWGAIISFVPMIFFRWIFFF